ncbi:MAG: multiheme c-type cytochrome [candidate division Zixibacteria bacterium]|nr:multiheme c-type cytochrome [candidate division Zixibacteria bacterium]
MGEKRNKFMALIFILVFMSFSSGWSQIAATISEDSESCLSCHSTFNSAIISDWEKSLHSKVMPVEALKKEILKRRVSAQKLPEEISSIVVGCAECHTMNPEKHKDSFEHNGFKVHTVVTPEDCGICHPEEKEEYGQNLMSYAYINLNDNPVYRDLINSINGIQTFDEGKIFFKTADDKTNSESCYYCHGTEVRVVGLNTRETPLGEMEFPVLAGWPNQGVGRMNPDGSMGSCSSCHTRHSFSIEMARKSYTCSECHKGPDVPAYKVYEVSKHGNIFSAMNEEWDFTSVPWIAGVNFTSPTCATCHSSLIADKNDEVIIERTHRMNDRLWWRIFGLVYAHPHPASANTSIIKNKSGLNLPTELSGEPVAEYLINEKEQSVRRENMQKVCLGCHSVQWVENQFLRLENTIQTTNEMTLTATKILVTAWDKGAASGLPHNSSIFDEAIEKKWVEQWLFYANSVRFASAMAGADYGVFANGRWYMSRNIQEMKDWLEFKLKGQSKKK